MMQGVVSIPHGWGHGRKKIKMGIAQANPGVSVNDLTDELLIDELTGNAGCEWGAGGGWRISLRVRLFRIGDNHSLTLEKAAKS